MMECEENTSDNDIDDSGERKTQKPKSQTDPQDEAKLVTKLWIAGLASTYGPGGVPTPLPKKLTSKVPTTKLPQLQLSPPSAKSHVNQQLADIDEAVRLVRAQTLASGDGRAGVSLEELSTVMLGLCRLVAENAKQLVVSARETEDELLMQTEDGEDAQLMSKMKKGGKRKEVEESATLAVKGQRNKRLKIDEVVELAKGEDEISEDEEEDAEGERMLPDFGLPTKLAMKESKCRGCVSPGDQLPLNAGRQLSEKVAYLYERKCRSMGSSGFKKKTALRSCDRRSRRSMTCDSGGGIQPHEHYDVDKVQEEDKKRQSARQSSSSDCVKNAISSLALSEDEEEEEEEMSVNLMLLYGGGKRKGSVKQQSGNASSNNYYQYSLPPRWRHMMMPRSGGISSAARVAADGNLPQQLSETASFRRTIRSTFTGTSRPTTVALYDFSARDRASIKSIIYAPDLRLTQPFCWQYQSPGPRAPFHFLSAHLSTSHDALGHVKRHEKGSLDALQQRLLAILSSPSSRGTLPLYEFDHLVRAAADNSSSSSLDANDELSESKSLSKQVLATHFVALLHLPLGTVNLRQKAPGGRRRPGLRLADFTSPATVTRKIYVSLIEEKPQELKLPSPQSPPI